MIAEGSVADGPNGQTAIFTGGKWVVQGSPAMPINAGDQEQIGKLGQDAQDAQWLAQKAGQFRNIQQGKGPDDVTGTGLQFHEFGIPHIAENINPLPMLAAAVNPRIKTLESVTNQAWTHMRPAGSGPMRMPEIEGFQEAFPNISSTPQANAMVADRLSGDALTAAQKLQFINSYIRAGKGNYPDANLAWLSNNTETNALPPAVANPANPPLYPGQQPGTAAPAPKIMDWDPRTGKIQ